MVASPISPRACPETWGDGIMARFRSALAAAAFLAAGSAQAADRGDPTDGLKLERMVLV